MKKAFSETLLKEFKVSYFFSEECGFLKTENPYWLYKAYQDAITDSDTGLVARNINNSKRLPAILKMLNIEKGKLLDIAGGYGMLTRVMRDYGYDFKCLNNFLNDKKRWYIQMKPVQEESHKNRFF